MSWCSDTPFSDKWEVELLSFIGMAGLVFLIRNVTRPLQQILKIFIKI